MSRLRDSAVRLVNLFRRERIERELDAELQAYLELDVEENIRRGMAPREARRTVLARLGGVEVVKDQCRDVQRFRVAEDLWRDLRYGVRMVLKHPGFSATAIIVLALGIGANTAIFSIINAMLLKPLPIHRPGELVGVYVERTTAPGGYRAFSYPNFQDLREQAAAFANLAAHNLTLVGIGDGKATRRVWADAVTANYFETFGVPLALGRAFTAAEEQPGANLPVAIVSHDYWVREGRRPDVLGETILVNAEPLTIVGVAAAGFTGSSVLFRPEVWLPLGLYGTVATDIAGTPGGSLRERDNYMLMAKGRLGPGHSFESVGPELEAIAARLSRAYPATNEDWTLRAAPLPRLIMSTSRPTTDGQFAALSALVLGMAGVVLLIACLNLANMLLARGASRRREMAIRLSLGGGRGRVVRQLLTEGFVLSIGGGAVRLVVAVWAAGALVRSIESVLPFGVAFGIGLDWRVLLGTLGFCLLGTLFFGLGPAWQMTGGDIVGDLKQRSNPEPRRGRGLPAPRDLLIVGQVALSLALLTAGGLFLRGAVAASSADPGFAFERGLLLETDPSLAGYDEVQGRTVYRDLLPRLRALPGVDAVSMASMVPFGSFSESREVVPVGADDQGGRAASFTLVADDYFRALGLSMLRGREFTRAEAEGGSGSATAIVDETLARALWPNADPLGQVVRLRQRDGELGDVTVVGVAPGRRSGISDQQPTPHFYLPAGAEYRANMHVHVRLAEPGRAAANAMLRPVRQAVRGFDARLPILSLQTLEDFRAASAGLWAVQVGASVFSTFGGLALFLAVVGLYGVKSYLVSQRTREIGLRMALGAERADVLWLVLRNGLVMTGAGLLFGVLLSVATARLLAGLLYEVRTFDPLVFALAPMLLAGSALLASYLPARRATRVSPMEALRQE